LVSVGVLFFIDIKLFIFGLMFLILLGVGLNGFFLMDFDDLAFTNQILVMAFCVLVAFSLRGYVLYEKGPLVSRDDVIDFVKVVQHKSIEDDVFETEEYIELRTELVDKWFVTEKDLSKYLKDLAALSNERYLKYCFIDELKGGKTYSSDYKETANYGYQDLDGKEVMVLDINRFYNDTSEIVLECLNEIKFDEPLVIDLRNNPGGSLSETLNILDLFLEEECELITLNYYNDTRTYISQDYIAFKSRIVILVNENTTSSAEIFAESLQANLSNQVEVVGGPTYGKNFGQTRYTFKESGFNLYLSDFTWSIPSLHSANNQGN